MKNIKTLTQEIQDGSLSDVEKLQNTKVAPKASRHAVHFSSKTPVWETPQDLFSELNDQFQFDVDVCALAENAKCKRFFSPEQDGLAQEWNGVVWMNPPYGKEIGVWMKKAYESSLTGATVVCLLPARTDTRWWHDYVSKASHIEFVKGRLKFGGCKNSAPFPSVIVVFGASDQPYSLLKYSLDNSSLGRRYQCRGLVLMPAS